MVSTIYKRILVGICGGIAAYKSATLVRLLRKQDIEVRVVMTEAAQHFIGPLTLQALTGHAVHLDLLNTAEENAMGHINLARWADAIIIAPASADIIAKMSHGLADDILSTLLLVAECPIFIAPAMNQSMWRKAVTQENINRLTSWGINIIGPESGEQACGETGAGRMSEPEAIYSHVLMRWNEPILQGKKILITAGPTREALDPVRYISNRSSGKMGYALANAAVQAGATVTLISGPVNLTPPANCKTVNIESAQQMYDAVMQHIAEIDIYIGAAAVADYRPAIQQAQKIKKQGEETTLLLQRNPDIVATVSDFTKNRPFVVGFAAETNNLAAYAKNKLQSKNLDMIAANQVGGEKSGFDSDDNELHVYWLHGEKKIPLANKQFIAEQLLKLIADRLNEKNTTEDLG